MNAEFLTSVGYYLMNLLGSIKMQKKKDSTVKSWLVHLNEGGFPLVIRPIPSPQHDSTKLQSDLLMWKCAKHVVSASGDICKSDSWIFYRNRQASQFCNSFNALSSTNPFQSANSSVSVGRICRIFVSEDLDDGNNVIVLIENFVISEHTDTRLNMLILTHPSTGKDSVESFSQVFPNISEV